MSEEPKPLTPEEVADRIADDHYGGSPKAVKTLRDDIQPLIATIRALEARARLIPQDVYATTASLVARAEAAEARVRRLRGHIRFIGGERLTDPAKPGDLEEPKR